jgi:hypothetical protein
MPRIRKHAKDIAADAAAFRIQKDSRPHGSSPNRPRIAVVNLRRQTLEQERQFENALQILISELVREQLQGRKD